MTRFRVLLSWLAALFGRSRRDDELSEEIEAHLDRLTSDYLRQGMSARGARWAARRAFGGAQQIREAYRDQQRLPMLDTVGQDARYALRQLRREPAFAITTVLTLALGIGATGAMFSVVDTALLRPLTYPHGDRLALVYESSRARPEMAVSAMHFLSWAEHVQTFERMALLDSVALNLTGRGEPERLVGGRASPSLFAMLGVHAQLGRLFTDDEDVIGRDRVIVLSDGLWRRRFGADPNIAGTRVTLSGDLYEIVGVLPRDFHFASYRQLSPVPAAIPSAQFWKPFGLQPTERTVVGGFNYFVLGLLKPGVSVAQATADLRAAQQIIASRLPQHLDLSAVVYPFAERVVRAVRPSLALLFASVFVVLLIGCINVTSLLLVKTMGRHRELALRRALGASRYRLLMQMLVETSVLGAIGGVLAIGIAYAGIQIIVGLAPADVPRLDEVSLDAHVVLFLIAATAIVSAAVGLAPALRSSALTAGAVANARGNGRTTTPSTFVRCWWGQKSR